MNCMKIVLLLGVLLIASATADVSRASVGLRARLIQRLQDAHTDFDASATSATLSLAAGSDVSSTRSTTTTKTTKTITSTSTHNNAAGVANTVLDSSTEFLSALSSVVDGTQCNAQYTVKPDLYGTLTNVGDYLDARGVDFENGGIYMAWLTDAQTMETFLNSAEEGCCGPHVTTLAQCYCQIAYRVGLRSQPPAQNDPADFLNYQQKSTYVVLPASGVTNQTSVPGTMALTVTTWDNLIGQISGSFPVIFAAQANQPSCKVDVTVMAAALKAAATSTDSWTNVFEANPDMAKKLGVDATGVDGATTAAFAALPGDELCTNDLAVRAFMWKYMDCNSLFRGTGLTSGGAAEYITLPNPKIATIPGEASKSTWLSSTPDAGTSEAHFCSNLGARTPGTSA